MMLASPATVALGDICSPKQHPTISGAQLTESGYPVYGANGQIGFYSSYTHTRPTIAVTCRGATCGTIHIVPALSYITGNAMALDNLDETKAELSYLAWCLRARGFQDVISGSAQPQITGQPLRRIKIALPALDAQRRIAAILDRADDLRRKRRLALEELNALPQAIFRDMFGDPTSSDFGYETRTLQSVCTRITDGTHQSPSWSDSGIPFIFVSNVRNGEIDLHTDKFISEALYCELTRTCPIEVGDVLYTAVGSYGHSAVINGPNRFAFQRHIAQLKPDRSQVDSAFLETVLQSPALRRQADKAARGVAQKTVTLADLKTFLVMCPPLELQRHFASRIAHVKGIRDLHELAAKRFDQLFASLQQHAFAGTLTISTAAVTLSSLQRNVQVLAV